jgi:hypothetical protein
MRDAQEYFYVFQTGKHKGKLLTAVLLSDPVFVANIYQRSFQRNVSIKTPNRLQLAIESILSKIKELNVTKKCPYCKTRVVQHFLLPDFGILNSKLLCCNHDDCKENLKSARAGALYEICDFLLLISFVPREQARQIVGIFKQTHANFAEAFS